MGFKRGTTFLRTFMLVTVAVLLVVIGMGSVVISSAEGALSASEPSYNNTVQLVPQQTDDAGIMPMSVVPPEQATSLTPTEFAEVRKYWDFEQGINLYRQFSPSTSAVAKMYLNNRSQSLSPPTNPTYINIAMRNKNTSQYWIAYKLLREVDKLASSLSPSLYMTVGAAYDPGDRVNIAYVDTKTVPTFIKTVKDGFSSICGRVPQCIRNRSL